MPIKLNKSQDKILFVLEGLMVKSGVKISYSPDTTRVSIQNNRRYIPDFELKWSEKDQHFLVYIQLASNDNSNMDVKNITGYAIATICNRLQATEFVNMYLYLIKNRANKKSIC